MGTSGDAVELQTYSGGRPGGHHGPTEVLTNVFARIPHAFDRFEVHPTTFHDAGETTNPQWHSINFAHLGSPSGPCAPRQGSQGGWRLGKRSWCASISPPRCGSSTARRTDDHYLDVRRVVRTKERARAAGTVGR
jgi:hypothetical protein